MYLLETTCCCCTLKFGLWMAFVYTFLVTSLRTCAWRDHYVPRLTPYPEDNTYLCMNVTLISLHTTSWMCYLMAMYTADGVYRSRLVLVGFVLHLFGSVVVLVLYIVVFVNQYELLEERKTSYTGGINSQSKVIILSPNLVRSCDSSGNRSLLDIKTEKNRLVRNLKSTKTTVYPRPTEEPSPDSSTAFIVDYSPYIMALTYRIPYPFAIVQCLFTELLNLYLLWVVSSYWYDFTIVMKRDLQEEDLAALESRHLPPRFLNWL